MGDIPEAAGVYEIRNIKDNKVYIGSSINIRKRLRHHVNSLNRGNHHSTHLQRAWAQYGQEGFSSQVVELVSDVSLLLDFEQKHIDHSKSHDRRYGYNINIFATGGHLSDETIEKIKRTKRERGTVISTDQRRKISNSLKGRPNPRMNGNKLGSLNIGKIRSIETRQKLSASLKGRVLSDSHRLALKAATSNPSEDTRKKISASLTGKIRSDETRRRCSEAQKGLYSERKRQNLETILLKRYGKIHRDHVLSTSYGSKAGLYKALRLDGLSCRDVDVLKQEGGRWVARKRNEPSPDPVLQRKLMMKSFLSEFRRQGSVAFAAQFMISEFGIRLGTIMGWRRYKEFRDKWDNIKEKHDRPSVSSTNDKSQLSLF